MNLKKVYSLECQICDVLHSLIADIYAPFKYQNVAPRAVQERHRALSFRRSLVLPYCTNNIYIRNT